MNFSINKKLFLLLQNQNMKKLFFFNNLDNYHFIIDAKQKITSNINIFDCYIKKYIKNYINSSLAYGIYEELKNIYINKDNIIFINDDKNNYKTIKIEKVFHSKIKNKFFKKFVKFENIFKLGETIKNNLPILISKFKYELKKENIDNKDQVNIADISLPPSNFSSKSIQIVNNIYKTGYDICNFNNEIYLKDFCFNNCDITQMSVSLLEKGNIKINILDKILDKLDNEKSKIELDDYNNWEKAYNLSQYKNYNYLFETKLKQKNFDNILSIIYQNLIIQKYKYRYNNMFSYFPEKLNLPPKFFNNISSNLYSDEISLYCPNNKNNLQPIESDILVSHPQLPLYLSSNTNGILFLYSFSEKKNKIIDEFYIDKIDSNSKFFINKLKFNLYGDNFMGCDTEGNLYNWNFDHLQSRKIPQNIIFNNPDNNNYFFCNDMCYLNNTGIIATISKKNTILFDFLMPEKKRKINDIFCGGNIILPLFSDNSLIISNNDSPGKISFIDLRKMEISKSVELFNINNPKNKNNNIKIMDMKLSEKENFLIAYGSDYTVKIFDITQKNNPLLIESLQAFNIDNKNINNLNEEKNFRGKLKLSSGYMFISKDNNIKLLRDNII